MRSGFEGEVAAPPTESTRLMVLGSASEILNNDDLLPSPSCCNDSLKSVVFGAIDGIVTAVCVAAATVGANLGWRITLCITISVVTASSISMGISEFLSSKAHKEYLLAEKRKELWEFKNFRDQEVHHMISAFEAKGMAKKDAEIVVHKIAQYESCFVNLMVSDELGLNVPQEEHDSALLTDAIIMLVSFGSFGLVSLIPFAAIAEDVVDPNMGLILFFLWSILIVGIFGASKSAFSNSSAFCMGMESIILSCTCALVAYFMGSLTISMVDDL